MISRVQCVLLFLCSVHGQGGMLDYTPFQNPFARAVHETYVKAKMAIMMDVDNKLTLVDLKPVHRTKGAKPKLPGEELVNEIGFYFYSKENVKTPVMYRSTNLTDLLKNEMFNLSKKTVVLVHGYLNNLTSPMIQLSLNALMQYEDVNVIAIDWYQVMSRQDSVYVWCAEDTLPVGNEVGRALSGLISGGLKSSLVHLVGHSLGAHVVGVAGKYLRQADQTVSRITGLDPAKIEFEDVPIHSIINVEDADYVDCIHSCGSYLAFERPLCHTDFYPNGGLFQPGCSFLSDICCICSHGRSYHYFAESIKPNHTFPSTQCVWTTNGLLGCTGSPQLMGYPAKSEYKGSFYTKTMSDYPFSPTVQRPPVYSLWRQLQAWLVSLELIVPNL